MDIVWKGSPNYDTNRKPIDRVVIHWFGGGTLESANSRFQNAANQVSAHYGISNSTVWQWVKEEHVAYHAGNYAMNQRSVGIEHDANPDKPLSEESYATSAALVRQICLKYNIPMDREHIIAHKEIKATQCPGTINLDRIISMASQAQPSSSQLLEYLGAQTDDAARSRLKEHLGERDGKCDWGSENGDRGGYLGAARRENKKLKEELNQARTNVTSSQEEVSRLQTQVNTLEVDLKHTQDERDLYQKQVIDLQFDLDNQVPAVPETPPDESKEEKQISSSLLIELLESFLKFVKGEK